MISKKASFAAASLVALSGCSSNGTGANGGPGGQTAVAGFTAQPGGGAANDGAGGTLTSGSGATTQGTGNQSAGNTTSVGGSSTHPGSGGSITNPGSGGSITNPGSGGTSTNPGSGGATTDTGSGGASSMGGSGAVGGGGGGITLVHCTQVGETASKPVTDSCSDITIATGTTLKLGPYGAKMDVNVGKGFENPNPNDDATCPSFVNLFAGETLSAQLLDTGPQPCTQSTPNTGNCLNYQLFTVYRPANWPQGTIPVITWGNGTCAQPEGYGGLLRYFASYGFFVVAANSRETGSGAPITKALDFIAAANKDSSSPYFGHLDLSKIGVAGHSQGGEGAAAAAADSRIQAAILVSPFPSGSTTKPFLIQAADQDVNAWTAASLSSQVQGASKAAFLYYHNPAGAAGDGFKGHLVLMLTPERVAPAFTAWWQIIFNNDATAKNMFVGSNCGLCGHSADYDFGEKGL